jgi:hypothetical protein
MMDRYHLILNRLVLEDGEYRRFYRQALASGEHYIILDNDAWEQGAASNIDALARGFEALTDQLPEKCFSHLEVVVPDVLGDCDATIRAARETAPVWTGWASDHSVMHFMLVPQGATQLEWLECLRALVDEYLGLGFSCGNVCIGIPRRNEGLEGGHRLSIQLVRMHSPDIPIHLLGIPNDPRHIAGLERSQFNIRGIDSAEPILHALYGDRPLSAAYLDEKRHQIRRPEDYFSLDKLSLDLTYSLYQDRVRQNVSGLREWLLRAPIEIPEGVRDEPRTD